MAVGLEFARVFMEQAVDDQADHVPPSALEVGDGGSAKLTREASKTLTTCVGNVEWDQPVSYLNESRRNFFPSGEGLGN